MSNFKLENYVPVNERLSKFYKDNPEGRVATSIIEHDREAGFVMIRAEIYRNADATLPAACGHAFEERGQGYVNKTSYIENAETSAVGRALALLGYQIEKSIASREEMEKVERMNEEPMKVTKEEAGYRVQPKHGTSYMVTKNGTIRCNCKKFSAKKQCDHIEAVRAFVTNIVPVEEMAF